MNRKKRDQVDFIRNKSLNVTHAWNVCLIPLKMYILTSSVDGVEGAGSAVVGLEVGLGVSGA